ncbi:hypothetical protein J2T10_000757 [Paenarthrobacter nicotinovorans]|uniref:DNA-binding FrmR family transcriptional regulator n=1 Tax=Paenarthrobacter nicotinovorans TaxID=29320 RepID=A0ABT9THL0_PAENI|nr:hypothetical protein [Paenarthrobacter nicotinovorans]
MSSDVLKARAASGVAHRKGDPAAILQAQRDLAAAKIVQYIERVISTAPELTPEQLDTITLLLRPGSGESTIGRSAGDAA